MWASLMRIGLIYFHLSFEQFIKKSMSKHGIAKEEKLSVSVVLLEQLREGQ